MPIPAFNIDGVLPPFTGPRGPGDHSQFMTPFAATSQEVVARFGTTINRCQILNGWLSHRALLYGLNITTGFQWLDGSFMESKEPNDLDIVTFLHRPTNAKDINAFRPLILNNPQVFDRNVAKAQFRLDAFAIDMDATVISTIDASAYYLGLFSHQRGTTLWKGMLRVGFDANGDAAARTSLAAVQANLQTVAVAP